MSSIDLTGDDESRSIELSNQNPSLSLSPVLFSDVPSSFFSETIDDANPGASLIENDDFASIPTAFGLPLPDQASVPFINFIDLTHEERPPAPIEEAQPDAASELAFGYVRCECFLQRSKPASPFVYIFSLFPWCSHDGGHHGRRHLAPERAALLCRVRRRNICFEFFA